MSFTDRLRRGLPRWSRRRLLSAGIVAVLLAGLITWVALPRPVSYTVSEQLLALRSGPTGTTPVTLDTTLYLPDRASATDPVPAVLLGHGFGGTKDSVSGDARDLADRGYAVLTWTARGFGNSGGQIHLNHPEYEVRDAQRLLDWLAERPEIRTDANGDPRVGVVGGSYGGALALLLAANDPRVDAIVPMITWHDLADAFLPESTGGGPERGVFKQAWAGLFFGTGAGGPGALTGLGEAPGQVEQPAEDGERAGAEPTDVAPRSDHAGDVACGRFAIDLCELYQRVAVNGGGDSQTVARLRESSPAGVLDQIEAPTLLIQGGADSLFPLSEADANAAGIAAAGTPVRVAWFTGGHDGGPGPDSDSDRLRYLTAQWLDHWVAGEDAPPPSSFTWSRVSGFSATGGGLVTTGYAADAYTGLDGADETIVEVSGQPQPVANPPAGNPAAVSSIPAAGGLASFVNGIVTDLPGQHARFVSQPLAAPVEVVGAPTVRLRAASVTGEAVLFVKLYDVDPSGVATLPGGLVAPVRLTGLPADLEDAEPVTVTLPGFARRLEAGHTLRVSVATTDQAYATPVDPAVYTVAVEGPVTLPTVEGDPIAGPEVVWRWVLAALVAALLLGLTVAVLVTRHRASSRSRSAGSGSRSAGHSGSDETEAASESVLTVEGLRKVYGDDFVAVSRIDLAVGPGQVVGLLGPNGAGKTTALRMIIGATRPTGGEIRIFGHRLTPGAPVLSRVGALVEGPGFLPHLTGHQNLLAFWRATGRPFAHARLEEAVEVAGLGESLHRRVRTYSHGMRQRLAIAQAMLGMPELLVLDEPTDGLDPPQIADLRQVLRRYAAQGRAVLVSSHLLAEVEQTCTHVVVVHRGEVIAAGPVDEITGESPTVALRVSDVEAAVRVLEELPGARVVESGTGPDLVVDVDGTPRVEVVARLVRAGVGVDRVVPRRRLEDAFLAMVGEHTTGSGDR